MSRKTPTGRKSYRKDLASNSSVNQYGKSPLVLSTTGGSQELTKSNKDAPNDPTSKMAHSDYMKHLTAASLDSNEGAPWTHRTEDIESSERSDEIFSGGTESRESNSAAHEENQIDENGDPLESCKFTYGASSLTCTPFQSGAPLEACESSTNTFDNDDSPAVHGNTEITFGLPKSDDMRKRGQSVVQNTHQEWSHHAIQQGYVENSSSKSHYSGTHEYGGSPTIRQNNRNTVGSFHYVPQSADIKSVIPQQGSMENSTLGCFSTFIFIIFCIGAVLATKILTSSNKTAEVASSAKTCEALAKLSQTVPQDIFRAIDVSVTGTLFRETSRPTILMFLQEDLEYVNKTVDEIANSIFDCFDSDGKKEVLDANYFKSIDDPGTAIELVQTELSEGGVLVVPNLHEIRGDVARAFHSICEVYPSLVKKLIVIFTLTPLGKRGMPIELAEKTLKYLWKDLQDYELQALITRVTDQVLWLRTT